ncbi:hypothetical protein FRC08_014108 [Ceratobasidium sp. 394]|nr:hypothetical protein FRC08_014108 [Ceratobasidium sp. 394]KAG9094002.1 hypothetical protein FS749_013311 [Ceratobasidium sp. UAMH 11750]
MIFANDEFFAYTLLSNVVRHPLRPQDLACEVETELEVLWKDVYLFVHGREYGFQEKTIADQTRTIVRRLLRTATREKAGSILNSDGVSDQSMGANLDSAELASALAWVEVSASRYESLLLSRWDQAWTHRWDKAWTHRWDEHWIKVMKKQDSSMGLRAVGNLGITSTRPIVGGEASGRAAGRMPVRVQHATQPTPPTSGNALYQVPSIQITIPEAKTSRLDSDHTNRLPVAYTGYGLIPYPKGCPVWTTMCELAAETGWTAAWERSAALGRSAAASPQTPEGTKAPKRSNTINSLVGGPLQKTSQLARRVSSALLPTNLAKSGRGLSVFPSGNDSKAESIEKMASPTSLVIAPETRNPQPDIQPKPSLQKQTASEDGTKRSKLQIDKIREVLLQGSPPSHHRALQGERAAISRQRRMRDQKRRAAVEQAEVMTIEEYPSRDDLARKASSAWECAVDMANSPERHLRDRAEREWMEAAAGSGIIIPNPLIGEEQRRQGMLAWQETFQEAWKATWNDSWMAAWQSTWEYGWREAVAKGIESGVDEVLKYTEAQDFRSLLEWESYQRVKGIIHAEDTYFDLLSRMRLLCMELDQLYATLHHSIPISHEHIMTIRVRQPKNPWTKLAEHLTEGTVETSSNSRVVSHFELQEIIEEQSQHRFQKHHIPHTAFIQGMAEVWEFTLQSGIEQN